MKTLTTIYNDQVQKPKSILDLTPFELAEIDARQDANRGWKDDDEGIECENHYYGEDY